MGIDTAEMHVSLPTTLDAHYKHLSEKIIVFDELKNHYYTKPLAANFRVFI
jgi:hypothetical protein